MPALRLLLIPVLASPALAQTLPPAPRPAADDDDIVVTATAPRGTVPGDIKPEISLSPADIRGYGVSSVADLLNELGPQLRSGRGGQPIVLLNGQRISGFQEIRDLPTEAILRTDILPEEAALKYGFPAGQRVLNIVLRPRFRATTAELNAGSATEGGTANAQGELGYLRIRDAGRLNIDFKAATTEGLTEPERPLSPANPFRSLTPDTQSYSGNLVYNRVLGRTAVTANARLQLDENERLTGAAVGLPPAALTQTTDSSTARLGLTANGNLARWRWTLTAGYDRVDSRTTTATNNPTTPNRGTSLANTGALDALISGPAFLLPAGEATLAVRAGASLSSLDATSRRNGLSTESTLTRNIGSGQLNLDLPLASARNDVLPWLGELSLNGNAAVQQLSDFGTLRTFGAGLNWRPAPRLSLLFSYTDDRDAPTPQQLGNPLITTPGVTLFDAVTGQSVVATQVGGGNPLLAASTARSLKLTGNWKPWEETDFNLTANFLSTRTDNLISAFPGTSAAIQAAFPERFIRDSAGTLTSVDTRPVNFARATDTQLRWGINFSMPLATRQPRPPEGWVPPWVREARARAAAGTPPPGGGSTAAPGQAGGPPSGGGFGGGGPGGGQGRGGGFGGNRLQFALYHTWHFTDSILVRPGGPVIDRLDGGSTSGNGGTPRHELELQSGYSRDGLGIRLSANWQSATRVLGPSPASTLDFADLGTLNLRLFFNPTQRWQLIDRAPWLRGTRVTLAVTNLLNNRQRVTDATGATPTAFQPAYLDPTGRRITLSLRKLFF
ncbi:TonB-dependent receptor [Sandaracinobacteroides saxicola]|uniref:TonB-dependent receptor n=1 Tax=Sandaracinobacteroides saxicola TaxID=2759707 RepID=A0A7G5IDW0_9SPHN|nr:TonB-dependent receptor [Sandaracinobacteroides saxicola]QMW21552.1 TonB-dependent receptor [Sandaracinobacteroides saxicola]